MVQYVDLGKLLVETIRYLFALSYIAKPKL